MDMVYNELLNTKHQNFVCIVDIAGATYRDALHEVQNFKGIQDLIWLFKEYEANYPETLYKAFVINSKLSIGDCHLQIRRKVWRVA